MKSSLAVLLTLVSFSVIAVGQNLTPVIDRNSQTDPSENIEAPGATETAGMAAAVPGDRYYQMQVLQEEVQMLRGLQTTMCSTSSVSETVT